MSAVPLCRLRLLNAACRPRQIIPPLLLHLLLVSMPAAAAAPSERVRLAAAPPEPAGYWTGDSNAPVPATLHGGKVVHARQLGRLLAAADAVVIDVSNTPRRPENLAPGAPWLPPVHQGIPGALWLPGFGLGVVPQSLDAYFRQRLADATQSHAGRAVVIYCHEKCWLSWNAAKRAISYGYRKVLWMPEGIEGWRAAGFATAALSPPPLANDLSSAATR